jgi:hypothetical protein
MLYYHKSAIYNIDYLWGLSYSNWWKLDIYCFVISVTKLHKDG